MKQVLRYIKIILIVLIVGPVAYGLLVEVVRLTPNYAVVLLDENKGI
jgi:hypothetical protein